MPKCDG